MIVIDGKQGEGGGQLLRTSLSLSAITGKPFRMFDIRAKRRNPGLQRQHLQCVLAAKHVSDGECIGAELNSRELEFHPGQVKSGNFKFDIKSAGSTTLVLQTLLPILFQADSVSEISIRGGTHNPMAPPYEFIRDSFLPAIGLCGFRAEVELVAHGFYPNGGGEIVATIQAAEKQQLQSIVLIERGDIRSIEPKVIISNLPLHIAERERDVIVEMLGCSMDDVELVMPSGASGPGNAVIITARFDDRAAVFSSFGEKGKKAEIVAREACKAYAEWRSSGAAVCPHLADQLLVYAAIGVGGRYTTSEITNHFETNADVIRHFIDVDISFEKREDLYEVKCFPTSNSHTSA